MSKTMNGGAGSEIMSFSTASKMMANGGDVVEVPLMPLPPPRPISDGSWELRLLVTDLQVERVLRVKSDLHVGGLMIKLVDELDIAMDWSDHAIWWPEKNMWLDKTRWTLDRYNLTADAIVHFTPMHKTLRVQLPDLRYVDCSVDFSVKTFNAVINLCQELGIRHPEEVSLCKPIDFEHLKFNYGDFRRSEEKKRRITLGVMNGTNGTVGNGRYSPPSGKLGRFSASTAELGVMDRSGGGYDTILRPDTNTFIGSSSTLGRKSGGWGNSILNGGNTSPRHNFRSLGRSGVGGGGSSLNIEHLNNRNNKMSAGNKHSSRNGLNGSATWKSNLSGGHYNGGALTPGLHGGSAWSLAMSPPPSQEAIYSIVRPKNLVQRARMNVAWLDSSLSIMEQGVNDFDTLLLRFKFHSFYDLNPKTDHVRINLVYEQAKWQLLNEGIDCTEEEMMLFAALQLQTGLQANVPQPPDGEYEEEDDIDAALTDLQLSLEGSSINGAAASCGSNGSCDDITTMPRLSEELRYFRPKKFTLKGFKRLHFVLRELNLSGYKTPREAEKGVSASLSVSLKGCEISPDIHIGTGKYGIKMSVPSSDGMSDLWLRCDNESQYARWMAACRMAAKGKTMADRGYDAEVKSIQAFLSMQHPASQPVINPATLDIQVEEYVASRFSRKSKSKLRHKILEAHTNVKDLNLMEAKMNFIKAWQSLPDYGVSLFVVRFHGEKKEELLGIAFNRIMRMSLHNGDHIKTWRFNTIKAWNINWETKHMMIQLGDGKNVIFQCLSADCKVVHEFIGGYIFLSMRSKDGNQQLDEELFHKLTGGWH